MIIYILKQSCLKGLLMLRILRGECKLLFKVESLIYILKKFVFWVVCQQK